MTVQQKKLLHIQTIKLCEEKIQSLPAGEIKYYLFILLNSIKEKNHAQTKDFLETFLALLNNLNKLHQIDLFEPTFFNEIVMQFNMLQTMAQTNTYSNQFKIILLHTIGAVASILCGIAGALIGGMVGLIRGTWNLEPFKGLGIGLFTGYFLGSILGFRTPKKLCKDEFLRQIEFGLNGLSRCMENLQQTITPPCEDAKPFAEYLKEEKEKIRTTCFDNNPEEFEKFLQEDITYKINSFKASFIGQPSLHGYLGQHFYIVLNIKKSDFVIEFTQAPADPNEIPDRQELRTVKGIKLIEMLALYNKFQETIPCTLGQVVKRMKPGDNDCHTFINKILIGTNQTATTLRRYNDMNSVGTMVGFFIKKLSPFSEDFFNPQLKKDTP